MRNRKWIRKCKVCEGYGEVCERTWQEPGFKEYECPCCKGTGKASARKVRRFYVQCQRDDEALVAMEQAAEHAEAEMRELRDDQ